jgi:hypothetical protein
VGNECGCGKKPAGTPAFSRASRYLDMVGVTGSIPVAPTIAPTNVSWRSSPRVFQADAVEERSCSDHHADG